MLASMATRVELETSAYRVSRRIRSGPTSSVFEVITPDRGRLAIKVLFSDDPSQRVRFLLEAAAQARVHHENVCPFLRLVRTPSGMPCIVMPLLAGTTLRELLATTGRFSPVRAATIMSELLRGLHAAHEVGIVHRAVTPSNILIGRLERESRRSTRAILMDFGLSKLDDVPIPVPRETLAKTRSTYLSPEIILGERVDPRSDVYAAGLVLFEIITGRAPFVDADDARVMEAHLDRNPPRLDVVAGAGRELADVVARALDKQPDRRWESARAFARALDAAIATS